MIGSADDARRQRLVRAAAGPGRGRCSGLSTTPGRARWRRSSPDRIDLTYVGPNPRSTPTSESRGDEIRVLAGAAEGGAALVVPGDGRIKTPADFRGRKVATPQFGNTQDVAARAWLTAAGIQGHADGRRRVGGADGQSRPAGAVHRGRDRRRVDGRAVGVAAGAWKPSGTDVSRADRDAVTTRAGGEREVPEGAPELAKKFRAAHAELTDWISAHEPEARRNSCATGLNAETHREIAGGTGRARGNGCISPDRHHAVRNCEKFVADARSAGFCATPIPLDRLFGRENYDRSQQELERLAGQAGGGERLEDVPHAPRPRAGARPTSG